jgi:hypothetical protein
MKALTAILVAAIISGCSTFTPPQGHPVLDDRIKGDHGQHEYVQFATTPERRVVLMNIANDRVCAEPSPDAAENLSYNLSAALSAKKTGAVEANASVSDALQSAAQSLFTRTQGVQYYRDGMFSLCLAYMNGAVSAADYPRLSQELRDKSFDLISQEIPYIAGIVKQKKTPQPPSSPATTWVSPPADGAAGPPTSVSPAQAPAPPPAPPAPSAPPGPAQPSAPAPPSTPQPSPK